ncbi:MAG: HYC_CC_PP family protein [Bacteroidia bacterium]
MITKLFQMLMALLVLVASSGMTINRMECFKTGKINTSLFDIKSCCPEDNSASNTIQSKCCDFSYSFHKVETNTTLEKDNYSQQLAISFLAHFTISFFSLSPQKVNETFFSNSLPPLLSGKSLLLAIQVFRI